MNIELKEKLKEQIEEANWPMLEDHYKRGGLIWASQDLDICEVGAQMATDNVEQIQEWLQSGLIKKPDEQDIHGFENSPDKKYIFIIVQPYVIIQNLAN